MKVRPALGILGGAFDPPHVGHVALARAAVEQLGLDRLLVLVVADPGHKGTTAPAETRLELARIAFSDISDAEVALDPHARTVDSLQAHEHGDAVFLMGGDELAAFERWKDPERVLELVRLGVALRPGIPEAELHEVRARLPVPDRISFFEMEPNPVSSTQIRERVARGESIEGLVPSGVAAAIDRLHLYRGE